jgi:hypothetical protein
MIIFYLICHANRTYGVEYGKSEILYGIPIVCGVQIKLAFQLRW